MYPPSPRTSSPCASLPAEFRISWQGVGEEDVHTAGAGRVRPGGGQLAVLFFEGVEAGGVVNVEDQEPRLPARGYADVGVGTLPPPAADDLRVRGGVVKAP